TVVQTCSLLICLAGSGAPEQRLEAQAVAQALGQAGDRLRLIPGRGERLVQLERTAREADERRSFEREIGHLVGLEALVGVLHSSSFGMACSASSAPGLLRSTHAERT